MLTSDCNIYLDMVMHHQYQPSIVELFIFRLCPLSFWIFISFVEIFATENSSLYLHVFLFDGREEIEKQKAHERYMRMQEQGKTEQARKDLGMVWSLMD